MNKRLLKRHKRQVSRAQERIRVSEPDVRTPEQVKAARLASRAVDDRSKGPNVHNSALSAQSPAIGKGGAAKTDA
jgi:hypothetical protein